LFSNREVADFLDQGFEPVWEMVRPVPLVKIDFGDGRVVTRTLHGNIASYVCTSDGCVIDILPGIYTADVHTNQLTRILSFADSLRTYSSSTLTQQLTRLQQYHQRQANAIRNNQPGDVWPVAPRNGGRGKNEIESPVERAITRNPSSAAATAAGGPIPTGPALAQWEALVEDTRRNEKERRLLIHDMLAASRLVRPEQIKRWLYKSVLNTDLDDPDLGLGDPLAGSEVMAR